MLLAGQTMAEESLSTDYTDSFIRSV